MGITQRVIAKMREGVLWMREVSYWQWEGNKKASLGHFQKYMVVKKEVYLQCERY